jgi:hypothetical protein
MAYPSEEEIRSLCTEQSFERGRNYYHQDRIQELDIDGEEISATVRGSRYYDVTIDVGPEPIRTRCSCPYDYAGDCKHIVAVLLAVEDRGPDVSTDEIDGSLSEAVDIDALIEQTEATDLRTFLREVIEDDRDVRDRFVAFVGADTGKTVYDYKQEINRLFDNAVSHRGMVEHDTYIDFSQYYDLAETHRERGHIDTATDIYRAVGETIHENLDRIDDNTGHYGRELENAIQSYAETVAEQDLAHNKKQAYIEYLCGEFVDAEYSFASDYYDDALRTLCTTRADYEYWLELLDSRISGVTLDSLIAGRSDRGQTTDSVSDQTRERTEDILYASDFTDGPLSIDDFTGGALDVEHLTVGPLQLAIFVGDAFEELRVDDPTTVEAHTVDIDSSSADGISSSLRTRSILLTYIYLLEELDNEAALSTLYEEIYLESSRFCKQYAERLREEGNEERAIEVLEDGIKTFRSTTDLEWLAADLYRGRDPDKYRDTLKQLFLDHREWEAYDDLKEACDDQQWQSMYEEFENRLSDDRQQLIRLYVHDGNLEKAFAELKDGESLSLLKRYRDPVSRVDPVGYFECYRGQLVPFAAGETGRRHYREIADHLDEIQELVPCERFEEFVEFLKEKHSNRPAFLDELEKAGF